MAKLYIIEHKYKEDTVSKWARSITLFTRNNVYHDAFLIEDYLGAWYFNFNIKDNYTIKRYRSLKSYIRNTDRVVDYEPLPVEVSREQIDKIFDWWSDKKRPPFSKRKFIFAGLRMLFMPLIWHYYKVMGKPYKPWMDAPKRDYCSTAVDKCIKECLGFDIIPELNENIPYPGLIIKALRERKNNEYNRTI